MKVANLAVVVALAGATVLSATGIQRACRSVSHHPDSTSSQGNPSKDLLSGEVGSIIGRQTATMAAETSQRAGPRPSRTALSVPRAGIPTTAVPKANNYESQLDVSVKGRVFPLPDSVVEQGKKYKGVSGPLGYDDQRQALALFADEARDVAWAPNLEKALLDSAGSDGGGSIVVRRIECRTTLCIVELASSNGLPDGLSYDEAKILDLRNMINMRGREVDASSKGINVLVTIYCRRSTNNFRPC